MVFLHSLFSSVSPVDSQLDLYRYVKYIWLWPFQVTSSTEMTCTSCRCLVGQNDDPGQVLLLIVLRFHSKSYPESFNPQKIFGFVKASQWYNYPRHTRRQLGKIYTVFFSCLVSIKFKIKCLYWFDSDVSVLYLPFWASSLANDNTFILLRTHASSVFLDFLY